MNVHSLARSLPASRALLVDRVRKQGWTAARAAGAAGISVRTAYKWLARYWAEGALGLRDRSSRPLRSPSRLPADREALVLELRRSRMTAKQIAKQLRLARPTVARALARNGVSRLSLLEPPKPANRYQWPNPGDLVQSTSRNSLESRASVTASLAASRASIRSNEWAGNSSTSASTTRVAWPTSRFSRTSEGRALSPFSIAPSGGFESAASGYAA